MYGSAIRNIWVMALFSFTKTPLLIWRKRKRRKTCFTRGCTPRILERRREREIWSKSFRWSWSLTHGYGWQKPGRVPLQHDGYCELWRSVSIGSSHVPSCDIHWRISLLVWRSLSVCISCSTRSPPFQIDQRFNQTIFSYFSCLDLRAKSFRFHVSVDFSFLQQHFRHSGNGRFRCRSGCCVHLLDTNAYVKKRMSHTFIVLETHVSGISVSKCKNDGSESSEDHCSKKTKHQKLPHLNSDADGRDREGRRTACFLFPHPCFLILVDQPIEMRLVRPPPQSLRQGIGRCNHWNTNMPMRKLQKCLNALLSADGDVYSKFSWKCNGHLFGGCDRRRQTFNFTSTPSVNSLLFVLGSKR